MESRSGLRIPRPSAAVRALRPRVCFTVIGLLAFIGLRDGSVLASDEVENFYRGKTLSIVVGNGQGAGNDTYSRVLARHIGRFMPGQPGAIVNNMPGASGLVAFNWLANVAPRDGGTFATASFSIPFEPIFGDGSARFRAPDLGWIGNMESGVSVCLARSDSGINHFSDLGKLELTVGAAARSGFPSQASRALIELTGARLKLIEGYVGTANIKLATERNEVQGICGISLSTVRAQWQELINSGAVRLLLQLSTTPDRSLNIPHVFEFAETPEKREVLGLIFGPQELGRAFAAPPDLPQDRLATLRLAFSHTMADDAFQLDARKLNLDLNPQTGEQVQKLVASLYAASPEVVAQTKKVLGR